MGPSITDVSGVLVGHAQDDAALTGCTVVLAPEGAVGAVDVRGGAPGTRETDLLAPVATVDMVHAVALCGGSAFGLAAATGVVQWLSEQGIGFPTGVRPVPIVPAAVIFDLA
ncbi:MAG: peptidase S58, partial [Roseiflexus castenholzii]